MSAPVQQSKLLGLQILLANSGSQAKELKTPRSAAVAANTRIRDISFELNRRSDSIEERIGTSNRKPARKAVFVSRSNRNRKANRLNSISNVDREVDGDDAKASQEKQENNAESSRKIDGKVTKASNRKRFRRQSTSTPEVEEKNEKCKVVNTVSPMELMNEDVINHIAQFLPPKDLLNFSFASRAIMHRLSRSWTSEKRLQISGMHYDSNQKNGRIVVEITRMKMKGNYFENHKLENVFASEERARIFIEKFQPQKLFFNGVLQLSTMPSSWWRGISDVHLSLKEGKLGNYLKLLSHTERVYLNMASDLDLILTLLRLEHVSVLRLHRVVAKAGDNVFELLTAKSRIHPLEEFSFKNSNTTCRVSPEMLHSFLTASSFKPGCNIVGTIKVLGTVNHFKQLFGSHLDLLKFDKKAKGSIYEHVSFNGGPKVELQFLE